MGEAGHVCRKLAFGESETQMLSMDNLFKGRHFDREIIILCVRWYLRFKVSLRRGPPCLIYLMDENAYLRTSLRSGRRQWGLRF